MSLELVSVKDRLEKGGITPPEPIVAGLLFRKTMAVLGAPDDSFKTHWALQLAISLAAGIPCFTYSCVKGMVVYLVLEGGEDYILERLEEKIGAMGIDRDEVMSRIYVRDCSQMRLDDEDVTTEIKNTLFSLSPKPDAVLFDPITYALDEDVRFSPERVKLCRNMLGIATAIEGVTLPIVHCRKGTQDNDSMDDFLGTSIIADAAATRIKLFRDKTDNNLLNMYVKTRYAERPEKTSMVWKYPLLDVIPETLKPREEIKIAIIESLKASSSERVILGELVNKIAEKTEHNSKTVRAVLANLEMEKRITVNSLPKSAIKIVKLPAEDEVYAS